MSSSYSANQYENAYKAHRLQNWTVPKQFKERPSTAEAHTTFIADDRGHLLPGVKSGTAWSDFKGTWELPVRIHPPRPINPTARSLEGLARLGVGPRGPLCTEGRGSVGAEGQMDREQSPPRSVSQHPSSQPSPAGERQAALLPSGPDRPASQAPERPASQEPERPGSQALERPASQEPERPGSQAPERPASQALERAKCAGRPATDQKTEGETPQTGSKR
ncbi:protein Flattop isoform X2 [Osmerus eperlanus]|uniref:protein Flattop isoform X2 n=1 Tax=Osmerus eperlanus TaxID=29151 RepID=UPI002E10AB80